MSPGGIRCPYVGLQPFSEDDYCFFFGRERDTRVISSNLQSAKLTVVYGPSGVGKSSVLRAGVIPHLRANAAGTAPAYFNSWHNRSFLDELTLVCQKALKDKESAFRLGHVTAAGSPRLLLVLDQVDEFLMYHAGGNADDEFDAALARTVNRDDIDVHVLIGIREDALSALDQRFGIRIANLLANTISVEHLSIEAGRSAIVEPLRTLNGMLGLNGDNCYSIEPSLIEEVLRDVRSARYVPGRNTRGLPEAAVQTHVETPFLQLVLRRLWDEETSSGSRVLRSQTLAQMGGARRIVDRHIHDVLVGMTDAQRRIAANMFRYMVTPSRSKVAQTTDDIIELAEAPENEVRQVLAILSDRPESRILRRFELPERYEIFHDVLAEPVLVWRREYFNRLESDKQKKEVRRLRAFLAALGVLTLVAIALAFYAFDQNQRANVALRRAEAAEQAAIAAQKTAESELALRLQAEAVAEGNTREADRQRGLAARLASEAKSATQIAERQRQESESNAGRAASYQNDLAAVRAERDGLQGRLRDKDSSLTAKQNEIDRLNKALDAATKPVPSANNNPPPPQKTSLPTPKSDTKSPVTQTARGTPSTGTWKRLPVPKLGTEALRWLPLSTRLPNGTGANSFVFLAALSTSNVATIYTIATNSPWWGQKNPKASDVERKLRLVAPNTVLTLGTYRSCTMTKLMQPNCVVTLPSGTRIRISATNLAYVPGNTDLVIEYWAQ